MNLSDHGAAVYCAQPGASLYYKRTPCPAHVSPTPTERVGFVRTPRLRLRVQAATLDADVRARSTSHSGMPQANLPGTSGIQLQEAPPKGASSETEPEIRPKRRVWICRGLCGFDGARPCWCCSPLCFLITLVVLWLLFLIIMFIGQAVEQGEVAKAPDTAWVYDTLDVCSASNRTYATLGAARGAGQLTRHCGACGQCSNAHDIQIYHDTKATLTETSTACAVRSITEGAAVCVYGVAARGPSLLG